MVLVNGSEGIGTGWSSSVPCYNPVDIIANIKKMLASEPMEEMTPWYKGYRGSLAYDPEKQNYVVYGIYEKIGENCIQITELPLHQWTQPYKDFLESLTKEGQTENQFPTILVSSSFFLSRSSRSSLLFSSLLFSSRSSLCFVSLLMNAN